MMSPSLRYAVRSLRVNLRRTLLSIFGIAFGVGIGLFALSWIRGQNAMMIHAAATGGLGHLRVVPRGWSERRDDDARLDDWAGEAARVRAVSGVRVVTPRAHVQALLGMGTRSAQVRLTGVDAALEPELLRHVRTVREGRYLDRDARAEIVLGKAIARRLNVEVDDELVVTVVDASGEMQTALLRVAGVVETGSRAIDLSIAHVTLADLEELSGRPGASEITLLVDDASRIDARRDQISTMLSSNHEAVTWLDVAPELRQNMESRGAMGALAIGIVLLVVLLGVASAQLTSVLERRRELAMLAALGTPPSSLVRVMLAEGTALGVASATLALAVMLPWLHALSTRGVDLSSMVPQGKEGLAFGGVLMDTVLHPSFGAWLVPTAFALALVATLLSSLYPAWFASRTDPATALRVGP